MCFLGGAQVGRGKSYGKEVKRIRRAEGSQYVA